MRERMGNDVFESPQEASGELGNAVSRVWDNGYECYGCNEHRRVPSDAHLEVYEHPDGLEGSHENHSSSSTWWLAGYCKDCEYQTAYKYMDV